MNGTVFLYSSHNRGHYLHDRFVAGRAVNGWANKRLLFLPMSDGRGADSQATQQLAWDNFRWFFDQYRHRGLEAFPFYWSPHLSRPDVDQLWHHLYHSEVVVLGGGHSLTGLERYKQLGARFDGEWGKFGRILHERQARGLLTVGFSAGADQLGERLWRSLHVGEAYNDGFALASNVMVTLHHEPSQASELAWGARVYPRERIFGLPNDSGLSIAQGRTPRGLHYQVIEFVIDNSWDDPSDAMHVKTREGVRIDHFYPDGRHWAFGGGEQMVRLRSDDFRFDESWIVAGGQAVHYASHARDGYHNVEHLISAH